MDVPRPASAARRSTLNIPPKPDASLAEWTSKIKELQKQVDEDEEAETRRLEAEIAASRQARLRRSTGYTSRSSSVDLCEFVKIRTIDKILMFYTTSSKCISTESRGPIPHCRQRPLSHRQAEKSRRRASETHGGEYFAKAHDANSSFDPSHPAQATCRAYVSRCIHWRARDWPKAHEARSAARRARSNTVRAANAHICSSSCLWSRWSCHAWYDGQWKRFRCISCNTRAGESTCQSCQRTASKRSSHQHPVIRARRRREG